MQCVYIMIYVVWFNIPVPKQFLVDADWFQLFILFSVLSWVGFRSLPCHNHICKTLPELEISRILKQKKKTKGESMLIKETVSFQSFICREHYSVFLKFLYNGINKGCENTRNKQIFAYNFVLCHESHTIQFVMIKFFFFKALWKKISILISSSFNW